VGNAMMTTTARKSTSVPSALASNTDMRGGGGGLPRELAQVNRRQAMCRSNDSALHVWLLDGWLVGWYLAQQNVDLGERWERAQTVSPRRAPAAP